MQTHGGDANEFRWTEREFRPGNYELRLRELAGVPIGLRLRFTVGGGRSSTLVYSIPKPANLLVRYRPGGGTTSGLPAQVAWELKPQRHGVETVDCEVGYDSPFESYPMRRDSSMDAFVATVPMGCLILMEFFDAGHFERRAIVVDDVDARMTILADDVYVVRLPLGSADVELAGLTPDCFELIASDGSTQAFKLAVDSHSGELLLRVQAPGRYRLVVDVPGFFATELSLEFSHAGREERHNLTLTPVTR